MPDRADLLTAADASEALGVARATIRDWVRNRWLRPVGTYGRRRYYRWADLLEADRRARRGVVVDGRS